MRKLSVLFIVFTAALLGCSAQVSVTGGKGDDGSSLDPQIVPGPVDAELTVTNGQPGLPTITPEAGNVELGSEQALFLAFTAEAQSHLLTIEQFAITLESPVGGLLVDAGGTPYFSGVKLVIGDTMKKVTPTVMVTPSALILDFEQGITVVPGNPTAAALYIDVANPAPPEDSALTFKGYVARLVPIEEGDVTDYGPAPWPHPPTGTVLPIDKIEQDNVLGGVQTPVPPSP